MKIPFPHTQQPSNTLHMPTTVSTHTRIHVSPPFRSKRRGRPPNPLVSVGWMPPPYVAPAAAETVLCSALCTAHALVYMVFVGQSGFCEETQWSGQEEGGRHRHTPSDTHTGIHTAQQLSTRNRNKHTSAPARTLEQVGGLRVHVHHVLDEVALEVGLGHAHRLQVTPVDRDLENRVR